MFGSLRRRVEMENGRKLTVNVNGYIYNMIIADCGNMEDT